MLEVIKEITPLAICAMKCITVIYVTAQVKNILFHVSSKQLGRILKLLEKLTK